MMTGSQEGVMPRSGVLAIVAGVVVAILPPVAAQQPGPADRLAARPLSLPRVGAGDRCPTSSGSRTTVPEQHHIFAARGWWYGAGPVYVALAWKDPADPAASFALAPVPRESQGHRAKTPWVAAPKYAGPILIRGRALDASARVLRFSADGRSSDERLELQARPEGSTTQWSFWPSSMWVPGSGCYAVQIDTLAGSDVVVFEATVQ
jgi:hypothetical protein